MQTHSVWLYAHQPHYQQHQTCLRDARLFTPSYVFNKTFRNTWIWRPQSFIVFTGNSLLRRCLFSSIIVAHRTLACGAAWWIEGSPTPITTHLISENSFMLFLDFFFFFYIIWYCGAQFYLPLVKTIWFLWLFPIMPLKLYTITPTVLLNSNLSLASDLL